MGGGAHADVGVEAAVDGEVVGGDVAQVALPDHVRLRSSSGGSAMSLSESVRAERGGWRTS